MGNNFISNLHRAEDPIDFKLGQLARELRQVRELQTKHSQRLYDLNQSLEELGEELALVRRRQLELMPSLDIPQKNEEEIKKK